MEQRPEREGFAIRRSSAGSLAGPDASIAHSATWVLDRPGGNKSRLLRDHPSLLFQPRWLVGNMASGDQERRFQPLVRLAFLCFCPILLQKQEGGCVKLESSPNQGLLHSNLPMYLEAIPSEIHYKEKVPCHFFTFPEGTHAY